MLEAVNNSEDTENAPLNAARAKLKKTSNKTKTQEQS